MNTRARKESNNEQLRDLVREAELQQAEALEIFNKALGPAAYSIDSWKAFFVRPTSARFRPFKDELLEHARTVLKPPKRRR